MFSLHKIVRFGIKGYFLFRTFEFDKNNVFVHKSLDLAPVSGLFFLVPRSFWYFDAYVWGGSQYISFSPSGSQRSSNLLIRYLLLGCWVWPGFGTGEICLPVDFAGAGVLNQKVTGFLYAPPMDACRGRAFRVPLFIALFLDDPHPSNSPRGSAPHSRRFTEGPLLWRS